MFGIVFFLLQKLERLKLLYKVVQNKLNNFIEENTQSEYENAKPCKRSAALASIFIFR